MVSKFTYLILCVLATTVRLDEPVVEDHVLVLTDDNFDEVIAKNEYILVEFYAPWCGHCKKLAPEYSAAAEVLKAEGLYLAKVDATVQTKTASRFSIQGYPTLKFFVNGKDTEYNGGRTKKDIVAWIKKKAGPSTKELDDIAAVEAFKSSSDVVVLVCSEGHSNFNDYAKTIDDIQFGVCDSDECISNYGAENGSVILFKNFDDKSNNLAKGYDQASFKAFIDSNSVPTIMKFDEKCAQLIFSKATPGLFLYYNKNSENAAALEAILNEVAPTIKDKIQVVSTGITQGLETKLAEYIGVTSSDLPSIRIHDTKVDLKKYNMEGEITVDNIKKIH